MKFYSLERPLMVYFYIILFIASECGARDYCSENVCVNNKHHVLCKYKVEQPSIKCINHEKIVRENNKRLILHKINDRRNKIAAGEIRSLPTAQNMRKVVWNDELALYAQRLADQCEANFNDVCSDIGKVSVGQTVAAVYGEAPGLTPAALVDVWYTELLNTNDTIVSSYKSSQEADASHYDYFTQLIWANSKEVGCGGVKYKEVHDQHNITVFRLICNFAPSGNRRGEEVYKTGPSCTGCLEHESCDSEFRSLCSTALKIELSTEPYTMEEIATKKKDNRIINNATANLGITEQTDNKSTIESEEISTFTDDDYLPFDFLSHILNNTKQTITASTEKTRSTPCKGTLPIDDLVEILKKKLSDDPMFKDILATGKTTNLHDNFTDASVSEFVGRLYSKKEKPTTTKIPEIDYVNSTLLADLVEAVIFRNADKYTMTTQKQVEEFIRFTAKVNPVKIQPELAQIKINNEFTGHYFFPEEETEEASETVTTESYYDNNESTDLPVSDVLLELEDIKRNVETTDFVDQILDSEPEGESPVETILTPENLEAYNTGHKNLNKYLNGIVEAGTEENNSHVFRIDSDGDGMKNIRERKRRHKNNSRKLRSQTDNLFGYHANKMYPDTRYTCNKRHDCNVLHYGDLLGKLASDIKFLKLNEIFNCSRGSCLYHTLTKTLYFYCVLLLYY